MCNRQERKILINRKYENFINYISKNLNLNIVEINTVNGHEFYNVLNIECNHKTGELISKVFYCDPSASWQKDGIEKNSKLIRYILPKKTIFKNLTQNAYNIIANHINSLCR